MSAEEAAARLLQACELHDLGVQLQWTRLRREHPGWSGDQIESAVLTWLRDRPGAEFGDFPGPRSLRTIPSTIPDTPAGTRP